MIPRILLVLALAASTTLARTPPVYTFPIAPLSPEEELKTIELPEGYSLELVLSEPTVKEPMAIAFDGNGKMYVAEMRTYMQDIDGTDELTRRAAFPCTRVPKETASSTNTASTSTTSFCPG